MSQMSRWDDDDQLMQDLDEALHGAVSDRARQAARAAFAWRTIDEDLMHLAHDSLVSEELMVRGAAVAPRVVGFLGSDFTLEVEVDAGTVMGQVVPGRVCQVSVVTPAGAFGSVTTDESGVFSLPAPDRGTVRFTVTCAGTTESTEWLTV
jgi:hypothetical protein